ncbi:hypothetical protein JOB18_005870 [Solea senegalensis]|uniref:Uncharacterized protein n=1 Tax=Solea senegalensis TaxID=28829 RepID=A0AAV6QRW8_SOLSE|nr:hypothetical protein JOB18_005870 [Solea senegalensis]
MYDFMFYDGKDSTNQHPLKDVVVQYSTRVTFRYNMRAAAAAAGGPRSRLHAAAVCHRDQI